MTSQEDGDRRKNVGLLSVKPAFVLPPASEPETDRGQDDPPKKRKRGQNANRKQPQARDHTVLCPSYAKNVACPFGNSYLSSHNCVDQSCKFSHSIPDFLAHKDEDIGDRCPVFEAVGQCNDGWRCRWLKGHLAKAEDSEGAVEGWKLLVNQNVLPLTLWPDSFQKAQRTPHEEINRIGQDTQKLLRQGFVPTPLSEQYMRSLEDLEHHETPPSRTEAAHTKQDNLATYVEPPLRPNEKRKINWPALHIVAPLTTLGNPPFRRLMRSLGAQLTYSEMILSQTLLAGQNAEWALTRAHPTETHRHSGPDNAYHGIQIAGGKVSPVVQTTELLHKLCGSGIDLIDLNCGCPLDMVCKTGAGAMLLENQGRLVKMLRGMVTVSGDIPTTCKIRMGWSNGKNVAGKLVNRLIKENVGVSAVTLHGRSRAQRPADWGYISECAAIIKRAKAEMEKATDSSYSNLEYGDVQPMAFIGNGDVYSYTDFYNAIENSGVDTCMIARGAIVKPWIFEEIEHRQHIDKSASERLEMLRKFAFWGLEHWVPFAHDPANARDRILSVFLLRVDFSVNL